MRPAGQRGQGLLSHRAVLIIVDRDPPAPLGEPLGDGAANATRRAGDEDGFVCHAHAYASACFLTRRLP